MKITNNPLRFSAFLAVYFIEYNDMGFELEDEDSSTPLRFAQNDEAFLKRGRRISFVDGSE